MPHSKYQPLLPMILLAIERASILLIIFGSAITGVISLMVWFVKKYLTRREAYSRREAKRLELHYRKLDAVIYAFMGSSDIIISQTFRKLYNEKMRELKEEGEELNEAEI